MRAPGSTYDPPPPPQIKREDKGNVYLKKGAPNHSEEKILTAEPVWPVWIFGAPGNV